MKIKIQTSKASKAIGPYSQAIMSDKFVFTSGQIYLSPDGKLVEGTIEKQTHQVMENLKVVLEEAGASFRDVVKATMYVTDMSLYSQINEVYAGYMTEPFPAREAVEVKALPKGAKIEISMIAIRTDD